MLIQSGLTWCFVQINNILLNLLCICTFIGELQTFFDLPSYVYILLFVLMLTVLHLTFPRGPFLMRWEMASQVIESEVGLFIDTGPYF